MSQPAVSPNVLLNLVLIFLTPMFLWAADGDLVVARQAALETLNAYRARTAISVITAARLIAFELACLASLSQSMEDDITPQLALRFRGNANTFDRAAERTRTVLERQRIPAGAEHLTEERAAAVAEAQQRVQQAAASLQEAPQPTVPPATPPAQPTSVVPSIQPATTAVPPTRPAAATVPPAQPNAAAQALVQPATRAVPPAQPTTATVPPPRMSEEQRRTAWAQAMTSVAAEFTAGLDRLPPPERAKEMMRINILTESASNLVAGVAPSNHPGNPAAAGLAAPAGTPGVR